MTELRKRFVSEVVGHTPKKILVTITQLPSGALEVQTNSMELVTKIDYVLNEYDDEFRLKRNPAVRIVGYALA